MSNQQLALLWDLDGTLVDTKECHFMTWQQTIQKHGFQLERAVFDANFGRNNRESVPLFLGFKPSPDLFNTIVEEKETLFRQLALTEARLTKGVLDWLKNARKLSIPQVIASSASMENIESLLNHFEIQDYFSACISGTDLPAKPAPDIFLKAAQFLEIEPAKCVVLEDSLPGVKAAKEAGMICIAVASHVPISQFGLANYVLNDFKEPFSGVLKALKLDRNL